MPQYIVMLLVLVLSPVAYLSCDSTPSSQEPITSRQETSRKDAGNGSAEKNSGQEQPESQASHEATPPEEAQIQPEAFREKEPEKVSEKEPEAPSYLRQLEAFFKSNGGRSSFTKHYVTALTTFFEVEALYDLNKYQEGKDKLATLWKTYPIGNSVWWRAGSNAKGTNVGNPVAYYGLRMLDDMIRFQLSAKAPSKSYDIVLTVVLVDCVKGVQPTTMKELEEGKGKNVTLRLQQGLKDNQYAVVKQSLKLFQQYIFAITKGYLNLKVEFLELATCATGRTTTKPYRLAGLQSTAELWPSIPKDVKKKTSWWWVLYPSLVPDQYPDFKTTEFITGGMGVGPNANSPCFIIDDQWLLRKPPHLGQGPYSDIERRIYLPQWLQHEFYHHLYRIYPSFELEKTGHQWFDRKTWPTDFVGQFEPDYYAESLAKRLQTSQAKPPLHVHLRYEEPPASLYQKVTESSLLGTYRREPKTNNWHEGVIEKNGTTLRWKNLAGVSWTLTLDASQGGLQTGPTNPYRNSPSGRLFQLSFARDSNGEYTTTLNGFFFNGEFYRRIP